MEALFLQILKEPVAFETPDAIFFKAFEDSDTWCAARESKKKDAPITVYDDQGAAKKCESYEVSGKKGRKKAGVSWMISSFATSEDTIEACEFFHEFAIAYLVRTHLSDIPSFSAAKLVGAEWKGTSPLRDAATVGNMKEKSSSGQHLYFYNANGEELEDKITSLTANELDSIIKQVLVSVRIAQHRIKLKHHDLHLGNVLLVPTEDTLWEVDAPEGRLRVPIVKYRAVIIDFGLASAVDPDSKKTIKRIDEPLIIAPPTSASDSTDGWGVWGSRLEGNEGYDVAMLVESMVEGLFLERPLSVKKIQLIVTLQKYVHINFSHRGRPLENCSIKWEDVWKELALL